MMYNIISIVVQVVYQLQDIFNLLPDVKMLEFVKSMYVKTNDQMLVVYLASLIRSIIALHNLIDNKIQNRDAEKNEGKDLKKEKKEEKGDGDSKKDDKSKDTADKKAVAKSKKWWVLVGVMMQKSECMFEWNLVMFKCALFMTWPETLILKKMKLSKMDEEVYEKASDYDTWVISRKMYV